MPDREKVIKAIETHLSTDISVGCDDCTYENDGWCTTRVLADALTLLKEQEDMGKELTDATELVHKKNARIIELLDLLKEQEEREKRICKAICDLIRGSCSTDTYADKEFVCHEIQKCFMEGR